MGRKQSRTVDLIDVNRRWSVWVGSMRGQAYCVGTVFAHDRLTALRTARATSPGTRIGFVSEEER